MDKEKVLGLLDQLKPILAGKAESIGAEMAKQLTATLDHTRAEVVRSEGMALGIRLQGLVQAVSNASLPGTELRFTDEEKPVWEELKSLTDKERTDIFRGVHLF
ncbi:hypothetical protein ACEE60_04220 [Streptococcus suis]|uniref:hypothetical protein n=1 Tax=unclassified Streptococcus TaxID=2608887 RepID=UPI000CF5889B